MDLQWTKAQLELKDSIIDFARRELSDDVIVRDHEGQFSRDLWDKCARFGILGLAIPQEYGGQGKSVLTTILAMEALGYACKDNGLTGALNGQMWSIQEPILSFGDQAQKRKYLPGLCNGTLLGAHGMTEPESGSDAFSLKTRAEKCDRGYVLNGSKTMIGLAPVCDVAIVFATTDPSLGQWGLSAFLVENGTPGFHTSKAIKKLGMRTNPTGELTFQDCFVPAENRLGPEGAGVSIFSVSMEWERSFIFASHVGAMQRQLEKAIAYARERQQFGQAIGKFQSISNQIVDIKVRLETARLHLYKAAWLKEEGKPAALQSSIAKLHISEAYLESSLDAIHVFGGKGYLTDTGIERDMRDATGGVLYTGTSDIQRVVIARLLGLG
jgi:alkylation response protein AidB-like acyl-CoA dehydrogenase